MESSRTVNRCNYRHLGGREETYRFVSLEKLFDDFLADVAARRRR